MADDIANQTLSLLREMRAEMSEMREEMTRMRLDVSRDVSGLSRHLRHHDADLEDIEKRLDLLET